MSRSVSRGSRVSLLVGRGGSISSLSKEPLHIHVLAIINSAAMNIGVHVSLSILVSSVCMPSIGIAGS